MSILKKFANMTRKSNINAAERWLEKNEKYDAGDYPHTCLNCQYCHYDGWISSSRGPYSCYKHDLEFKENEAKTYRCKDFTPKDCGFIEF